jgi:putative DNA primase/helicase
MSTVTWSEFASAGARVVARRDGTWPALIERLRTAGGFPNKAACPWVKLATFGDLRSKKGSLRNSANVRHITGVEGDYDGEEVTPDQALQRLERAGIKAVVYTSARHRPEAPRWRVLAPLSRPMPPQARAALLARVNGALGGILAGESFTLSQAYYFGAVADAVDYRVLCTFDDPDEGGHVDELDELDELAIGKVVPANGTDHDVPRPGEDTFAQAVARHGRRLRTGDGRREMLKAYIASRSARGLRGDDLRLLVDGVAARYFDLADPFTPEDVRGLIQHANSRDDQRQQEGQRLADGLLGDIRAATLICATALKPQAIRWLWPHWLARGKLHVLAGAPGQGKTTLVLSFAATVSAGGRWPDGMRCPPGNVVIWSGEDDPEDTLLPRLLAMGADPKRIFFVKGVSEDGQPQPFDPSRDMQALVAAVEEVGGCALLMVDPVVSAVAGDSHKNGEVRRALQPLVDLCAALDCAAVGISHFSKGTGGREPTERVVGSVAFSAVARVVLVAAKVKGEDGEARRILARSKSNLGPDEGGFEYEIEQVDLVAHPGVQASRVTWGQALEGTARELLAEPDDQQRSEGSAQDAAAEFLLQVLGADVVPVKTIEAEARAAGVAWRTVRRAADELSVIKRKAGMGAGWYWSLPKMTTKESKVSNVSGWTSSASSVDTFDAEALSADAAIDAEDFQ